MEERIDDLKSSGNAALQAGNFAKAAMLYTSAIELDESSPLLPVLYSNRAMAQIKAESYGLAIADAEESIRLDPSYIKAYYRRGSANFALGKYKLALRDFKSVCRLRPTDKDARAKLKECEKAVKQIAFANAILSDQSEEEKVDVDSIVVESDYDGPRMDDEDEGGQGLSDEFVEAVLERFRDQKLIHRKYVLKILFGIRDILSNESSLVDLTLPENGKYTVCGDVHGQYYDLLKIFDLNGLPSPDNPYVFNGDFVDRGSFSFEVVLALFMLKLRHPKGVHLNRGNHETKNMTKIYGFEGEIRHKMDNTILNIFHECFCLLPLAAVLEDKVFIVHGGLAADDDVTLADVRAISRQRQPPDSGLMCDLLWSDPQPEPGRAPSKRGVGLSFGPDVTKRFLEKNDLDLVIRSHEVRDNGYEVEHDGQLITVFSAPNYCLTEDMQILTRNHGFVSLCDYSPDCVVAGYDPETQSLIWEKPSALIVNAARDTTVLDFSTPRILGKSWWDFDSSSGAASLSVTADHQMYVGKKGSYEKCRADDIFSSSSNADSSAVDFKSAATNGCNDERDSLFDGLFDDSRETTAFFELFGHTHREEKDESWMEERLRAIGGRHRFEAIQSRLPPDLFSSLGAEKARAVFRGLGPSVHTSSPIFRDQLIALALCAGLSPQSSNERGGWLVSTSGKTELRVKSSDVSSVPYFGRTWCVTMPSGFIWARRAAKTTTGGVAADKVSRPILVGNCDAMGNKGAFIHLDHSLKPEFTTYDAAPHPPIRPMHYASQHFGL